MLYYSVYSIKNMAHLPQDELPSEFDVVVDGTGEWASVCFI